MNLEEAEARISQLESQVRSMKGLLQQVSEATSADIERLIESSSASLTRALGDTLQLQEREIQGLQNQIKTLSNLVVGDSDRHKGLVEELQTVSRTVETHQREMYERWVGTGKAGTDEEIGLHAKIHRLWSDLHDRLTRKKTLIGWVTGGGVVVGMYVLNLIATSNKDTNLANINRVASVESEVKVVHNLIQSHYIERLREDSATKTQIARLDERAKKLEVDTATLLQRLRSR